MPTNLLKTLKITKPTQERLKTAFKLVTLLVIAYVLIDYTLIPLLNSPDFQQLLNRYTLFGYFVVILYTVISHVIAPIVGTPGVAVGMSLYGIAVGSLLLFFSSQISAVINFYLARKYGRNLIRKLTGKNSYRQVEKLADAITWKNLFVLRILGFGVYELVSYAAGITKVSFKKYYLSTLISSILMTGLVYFGFRNNDFRTTSGIIIWYASFIIPSVIFGWLLWRYIDKYKAKQLT